MRRQNGFTLLELVGVLAVMAILAGTLAPNIADSIDRAYAEAERENMAALARGLEQAILQQKRIPSPRTEDWVTAIAETSALARERIARNDRGHARRLVFDPRFFSKQARRFSGFSQNRGLKQRPLSPRIMLISGLKQRPPAIKNTAAAFDAVWNQTADAVIRESDDIIIERLNLAPHFHRVILGNQDSRRPYYRLESGAATPLPRARNNRDGTLTRYVLSGTRLALYHAPYPSGRLQQTAVVQADYAMRYQSATAGAASAAGDGDDDDDWKKRKNRKNNRRGNDATWRWARP